MAWQLQGYAFLVSITHISWMRLYILSGFDHVRWAAALHQR